jgi:anti-sigma regulatory factor (Ser/Thr protein kinase)
MRFRPETVQPSDDLLLTLANRMEDVAGATLTLECFLQERGIGPDLVFPAVLALEEVVTNVIKYGYDDDREHEMLIEVHIGAGTLMLRVADDGHEFDPLRQAPPDLEQPLEERPIGGLGIHLLRQVTERIEYRRVDGRNVLTLFFDLASKP